MCNIIVKIYTYIHAYIRCALYALVQSLHIRKLRVVELCGMLIVGECIHYDAHSCIGNINGFYRTLVRARAKYKREGVVTMYIGYACKP